MNIQQAKQIPLRNLVEHLGGRFSHKDGQGHGWYFSPFRPDEHTASFKVDEKANKWHDFAKTNKIDAHGDIIDLWTDYHKLPRGQSHSIKQALSNLRVFKNGFISEENTSHERQTSIALRSPRYRLMKQPCKIWIDSLKKELIRRRLTLASVDTYLKQGIIEDAKTKKRYYGFAFGNDKGGYEISIPNPHKQQCFKTAVAPKAITTIPGTDQTAAYVFEGVWDGLTWLAMRKDNVAIGTLYILNSTSMAGELADQLIEKRNTIQRIFLFMDNDDAGLKAQTYLLDRLESYDFKIGTMNALYKGYKDLSEHWMNANSKQAGILPPQLNQ